MASGMNDILTVQSVVTDVQQHVVFQRVDQEGICNALPIRISVHCDMTHRVRTHKLKTRCALFNTVMKIQVPQTVGNSLNIRATIIDTKEFCLTRLREVII